MLDHVYVQFMHLASKQGMNPKALLTGSATRHGCRRSMQACNSLCHGQPGPWQSPATTAGQAVTVAVARFNEGFLKPKSKIQRFRRW